MYDDVYRACQKWLRERFPHEPTSFTGAIFSPKGIKRYQNRTKENVAKVPKPPRTPKPPKKKLTKEERSAVCKQVWANLSPEAKQERMDRINSNRKQHNPLGLPRWKTQKCLEYQRKYNRNKRAKMTPEQKAECNAKRRKLYAESKAVKVSS